jgi:hypothetical protein
MILPFALIGTSVASIMHLMQKPAPTPPPAQPQQPAVLGAAGPLPEFADIVDPLDVVAPR